jgi:hypothetical protein
MFIGARPVSIQRVRVDVKRSKSVRNVIVSDRYKEFYV